MHHIRPPRQVCKAVCAVVVDAAAAAADYYRTRCLANSEVERGACWTGSAWRWIRIAVVSNVGLARQMPFMGADTKQA
jgi:hypothetical protein